MADGESGMKFPNFIVPRSFIRFSEIFLRDDVGVIKSGTSTHHDYLSLAPAASSSFQKTCTTTTEESGTDHAIIDCLCVEDLELVQEMDSLGLPLSFGTSKERSNVSSRSKRNDTKPKFARHEKERNNQVIQIMVFSKMEIPASSKYLHGSTNMSSCLHAVEGQVDTSCHDAKQHGRGDLHLDESASASSLGSENETVKKHFLYEVSDANSENLDRFEFSLDTVLVSFQLNAEVLGSLSLHGDSCPEEIFGDVCSLALFHEDGELMNKRDLDKFSEDSSSLCCNMHLKWDTHTPQSSVLAEFSLCTFGDCHDNLICCEHGAWRVVWDPFYKSNYFVNVETQESTWYPPPGLEEYAFPCSDLCQKETDVGAAEKDTESEHSCSFSVVRDSLLENEGDFHFTDEQPVKISDKMEAETDFYSHYTIVGNENSNVQLSLYPSIVTDDVKDEENECEDLDEQKEKQQGGIHSSYYEHDGSMFTINESGNAFGCPETYSSSSTGLNSAHENVTVNKKRRVRKSQSQKLQERTKYLSNSLVKYWNQRYSLFYRFDYGIKMDEESWFSVTPELIAKHHAFRCGPGTIIDCFTGVGGNAIQFAMRGNHVIAIDVDPQKIEYAQQNALIYEVSERINFINGDFFEIAPSLKGDVAFLAPPWGGPDYAKTQLYDMNSLRPREGYYLFQIASKIAAKVVMFLPRNVNLHQLVDLSLSADPPWNLEVEKNYLNGKLKSITAYFEKATTD